jgi:hypothetical protein
LLASGQWNVIKARECRRNPLTHDPKDKRHPRAQKKMLDARPCQESELRTGGISAEDKPDWTTWLYNDRHGHYDDLPEAKLIMPQANQREEQK